MRDGRNYLCACSIEEEQGAAARDGAVSVTLMRSLKDRLFGANKYVADDPLPNIIFDLLAAHPEISALRRE